MKKIVGMLLAFSLVLGSAVPAFAAEMNSAGLEKAINQVKNVVTIPSDYKDFQYSSSQYEDNGKTITVWYLNWNKSDYSGGISATVENNGYLINFNKFVNKANEGLGTVTKEAAQKTANTFLAKVRPDIAAEMRATKDSDYSSTDRHSFRYRLYKNDAVVSYVEARVEVDKYTGEIIGYNFQGSGEDLTKLPSAAGIISLEEAQKAYLEKIKVPLNYYSNYDYNKKVLTVFPAYAGNGENGKVIDAKTGEAVKLYNEYRIFGDAGGYAKAKTESAANDNQLTKEELAAVDSLSGLISKEKAESILRASAPGITGSMKVTNASLSKSYNEPGKYLWEIGFDGAYGVVNAKSGEMTSFYLYGENSSKGSSNLTEAKAKEKAEAFLKKTASEKFAQSRFYESPNYVLYKSMDNVTDFSFNYYRQVNGIDFVGNGFTIIVNKASGLITHYDLSWFDDVKFPSIDKVISSDAAFDAFNKEGQLGLMYKKVNDGETALVYDFVNATGNFLIDPATGAKLGWDGKPYKDSSIPSYSDMKGHWAEAAVEKLLDNGYYLTGEKFNPNTKITQLNFLRYLYSPIQAYYDEDEFYKMLINDKIIKENEKAPGAALTRQDAAKFAVRYLGQGKAAEHSEIFINPFSDSISNSYKGYAAICYGFGIMKGDKNGRFNGSNQVTNAEAATIIYNVLQVK